MTNPNNWEFVGRRFGRLTVMREGTPFNNARRLVCKCDCGREISAFANFLADGRSKQCKGCNAKDKKRS